MEPTPEAASAAPRPRAVTIPLFEMVDYREFLRYVIEARRDIKGIRSRLAEAARCQPSHLTQVLTEAAALSMDQLRGISRFLELDEREWDYLRELGIMDRAGSAELKADCLRRLARIRRGTAVPEPSARVAPSQEDMAWYASSWVHSAICAAVHSKALRKPAHMARAFDLPLPRIEVMINELVARGFLKSGAAGLETGFAEAIYLGRGPAQAFRTNWFLRGHAKYCEGYQDGCQHASLFCLTRAEYDELKSRLRAEHRRFFSTLPLETEGDVVVYYGVDVFEVGGGR